MEKFEAIKTAHVIDQLIGNLILAVADEGLKKKILTVQAEWRELAYLITAHLCGVESGVLSGTSKKKVSRKRDERVTEQAGYGDSEAPQTTDEEEAT